MFCSVLLDNRICIGERVSIYLVTLEVDGEHSRTRN